MDEEQKNKIKELLDKNGYRVQVKNIEDGIVAIFPARIDPPSISQISFNYIFKDRSIQIYLKDNDDNIKAEFEHPCPKYAQKLLVLADILKRCSRINYSILLIQFLLDSEEVEDEIFFTEIQDKDGKAEILKPIVFSLIYGEGNADAIAQALGVYEGYVSIKKFLELSYGENK